MGAIAINTVLTFGLLAAAMTIGFILTVPDVPVQPLVLALFGVAIVVPVVAYPWTYTIWLAFDLAVHPPDRAELDDAAAAREQPRASSSTGQVRRSRST